MVHLLLVEITIECHGDVADEDAAERSDANFRGIEEDEAFVARFFQALQFRREIFIKINGEFAFDFVFGDHGVAEQAADHGAAQQIVGRKPVTAHGGDAARADRFLVRRNFAAILRVGRTDGTDRADAHAVKVCAGFRGVALKIAMQRAILLCDGQFIAGAREVVHANIEVARAEETLEAGAEDAEFFHSFGQVRFERALLLFQPGHVGVAEHGDAIGRERQSFINRVLETFRGLVGQAVDQIHVEAFETELARGGDQIARHFVGLHAMNRFLHLGLEILDAHAQAVEAEAAQGFQMGAIGDARVNLDADLRVWREGESLARVAEQIFHLCGSQIGGRSAAPVKLNHRTIFGNALADVFDLAFQGVEIWDGDVLVFLNGNIARAEQAEAFAEGNVHVERKWRGIFFGAGVEAFQIVGAEIIFPDRRGGIAGVARTGPIIFFKSGVGDLGDFELVGWFHFNVCYRELVVYAMPARAGMRADFPAATKALAFSTGVVGRIPWPRFRMWPRPPVFSTAACAASRTAFSEPSKIFGSTFPCNATLRPATRSNVARASAKSVRQSTLITPAPVAGKLSSKCAEPFAKRIFGTSACPSKSYTIFVAGSSNESYSARVSSPAQVSNN